MNFAIFSDSFCLIMKNIHWAKTYIPMFCPLVGISAGLNIFPVVLYPGGWLDIVKGFICPERYPYGG